MVTILISTTFRDAALIRGEALIRGRRLFQCGYPKLRRLLEKIRYFNSKIVSYCKILEINVYIYSWYNNTFINIFINGYLCGC